MATFTTYAVILSPDHPMLKISKAAATWRPSRYRPAAIEQAMRADPGVVLGDVLQRTGGAYETTTRLTPKLREDRRSPSIGSCVGTTHRARPRARRAASIRASITRTSSSSTRYAARSATRRAKPSASFTRATTAPKLSSTLHFWASPTVPKSLRLRRGSNAEASERALGAFF